MLSLYDLRATVPPKHAQRAFVGRLYTQGVATLRFAVPFYDLSNRSAYHLGHLTNPTRPVFAAKDYHPRHIAYLRLLHSVTGEQRFLFYANLWASYDW